jgi:hypothetical protein
MNTDQRLLQPEECAVALVYFLAGLAFGLESAPSAVD